MTHIIFWEVTPGNEFPLFNLKDRIYVNLWGNFGSFHNDIYMWVIYMPTEGLL